MRLFILFAGLFLVLTSCNKYPNDTSSLQDQDLVITHYDATVSWPAYKTYAIGDTVLFLKNKAGRVEADTGYSQYNNRILDNINNNMVAQGFVRVGKNQNPHIAVDVTLINDANIESYTSWYGSSWYWGYPSYGYYYPWPTTTYYKYEVGSIQVNFLDITRVDTSSKRIPLIWGSQAVGTVSSDATYNATRVDRAINIMFEQSPYLKK
ncbi:MAG: DUF4136 domain-containing protein [Flavobacteriales bacterium]|nr:DUF4136 domain-containing protein [Flavobacteriales bacterium]